MNNFIKGIIRWLRYNLMYLGTPPWDTGISPPELIQYIRDNPPGRVIDLGCGTGTNLVTLARAGWQVTGVDFIPSAALKARKRLWDERLKGEVRTGDLTRLDIVRGKYDLVLDIGCYHGLSPEGRAAYKSNLGPILTTNGKLLLYANWVKDEANSRLQQKNNRKSSKMGIGQGDLSDFLRFLKIEEKQDSQDRWGRQASWIIFSKKGKNGEC